MVDSVAKAVDGANKVDKGIGDSLNGKGDADDLLSAKQQQFGGVRGAIESGAGYGAGKPGLRDQEYFKRLPELAKPPPLTKLPCDCK